MGMDFLALRNLRKAPHFFYIVILSLWLCSSHACGQNVPISTNPTGTQAGFSLVAIGDAGERNGILEDNAETIAALFRRERFDLLVFLGDNFYKTGLNFDSEKDPQKETPKKINSVLGPFRAVMRALGRQNVHAVAGNHDYYAQLAVNKSFLWGLFSVEALPVGITNKGNQRADTISTWTYHYGLPQQALFPVDSAAGDSLQIIFFDSAVLLRTQQHTWRPYFAALERLLFSTSNRPQIKWRIIAAHHPLHSLGEHGGYSEWDPEARTVRYLNHCDPDSDIVGYFTNFADPEDLCAERYRAYRDSLLAAIHRGGVPVQLFMAGHDHSLQLLHYSNRAPDCSACPQAFLISGAGAKVSRVRAPAPELGEHTWPDNSSKQRGKSRYGFARIDIQGERLRIRIFDGKTGKELDMGTGRTEFFVKPDGTPAER
jgi:predicted phosphodiesterase